MKIYHNPGCGKCRAALSLLRENDAEFEVVEYLKNTPGERELRDVLQKLGKKPLDIIRKKEPVFIEKFKGKELSDEEWIRVMVENPILIERPIVVKGDKAVIGRPPENVKDLL